MNAIYGTPLSHLNAFTVTGKDAVKFLQGQCTQDIESLAINTSAAGAFCTAKGRIVTNVWLHKKSEQCVWVICHQTTHAAIQKHLAKYVAFFRGTLIEPLPDNIKLFGYYDTKIASDENKTVFAVHPELSYVWLNTDRETLPSCHPDMPNESAWRAKEIAHKVLWLDDQQIEKWIPQNVSLDDVLGISYTKGCYTGQEVVARLHYKGASKKSLVAIQYEGSSISKDLVQQGKVIGDIIQQSPLNNGTIALAVIKTDALEHPISLGGTQQSPIQVLS